MKARGARRRSPSAKQGAETTEMLTGVDAIDWAGMEIMYGRTAADAPDLLRTASAPAQADRAPGVNGLLDLARWQEVIQQPAPRLAPFVAELIGSPRIEDAEDLIALFHALSVSDLVDWTLPHGYDVATARARQADARAGRDPWPDRRGPGADIEAYFACQDGAGQLSQRLIGGTDAERIWAFYALAWFPEIAEDFLPEMLMTWAWQTDAARAHATLACGLMARGAGVAPDELSEDLDHPAALLRTAAAIATAREPVDRERRDALIDAIAVPDAVNVSPGTPPLFLHGDISRYAELTLVAFAGDTVLAAVDALGLRLQQADGEERRRLARPLVSLALAQRGISERARPPEKPLRADKLSSVERSILEATLELAPWDDPGPTNVHYPDDFRRRLRTFGAPDEEEALRAYLQNR